MGFNKAETHRRLGITRSTIDSYLEKGAPEHIALACAALAYGLPAWKKVS